MTTETRSQATATAVLADGDASDTENRTIHGVAISDDEITNGLHGKKKWVPEELEKAAGTLKGSTVTSAQNVGDIDVEGALIETNHGDRVRVGQITDSAYESGVGVVYEMDVENEDIYSALALGSLDISIEASDPSEVDEDEETGALIMRDYVFDGMDVVEKGAARSNHTAAGPAANNAAIAALSAQDVDDMLDEKAEEQAEADADEAEAEAEAEPESESESESDPESDAGDTDDPSEDFSGSHEDLSDIDEDAGDTDDPSEGEVSADAGSDSDSDADDPADSQDSPEDEVPDDGMDVKNRSNSEETQADESADEDVGDTPEEDDDPASPESTSGPESSDEVEDGNSDEQAETDAEGSTDDPDRSGESERGASEANENDSTMADTTPDDEESTDNQNQSQTTPEEEDGGQQAGLNLDGQVVIDEDRHDELKTKAAMAEQYENENDELKRDLKEREEQIDTVHSVYSAALAEAGPHSEEFYAEMPLDTLRKELSNTQGVEDDKAALEEAVTNDQPLPQTGDQSAGEGANEAALEEADETAQAALRLDDTAALASSEQSAYDYVQDKFGVDATDYDDDIELRDAIYSDGAAAAGGDD